MMDRLARTALTGATVFIFFLLLGGASLADGCKLQQAASLDMVPSSDGHLLVALPVSGVERYFYLEIADPFSSISTDFAFHAGFDQQALQRNAAPIILGQLIKQTAIVPSLQMGRVSGTNVRLAMLPKFELPDKRAIGILGLDLLTSFDVELDFSKNKLNLFSTDHCPGQVVYWAKQFASTTLQPDKNWHLYWRAEMMLDGQPVLVAFSTLSDHSLMPLSLAHSLFGISTDSAGLVTTTEATYGTRPIYKYPFKNLSVDGLAISNPNILIYSDAGEIVCDNHAKFGPAGIRCETAGDFVLTLSELRKLHLYFAFGENMLYLTAADAH